MKSLALFTVAVGTLIVSPCLAQQQLSWPSNPQPGGFPAGNPGIPAYVAVNGGAGKWNADQIQIGDQVLLELIDKPAAAYLKLYGHDVQNWGVGTSLEARVIKKDPEKVVVEFQNETSKDKESGRLISVTSVVPLTQLSAPSNYSEPVSVIANENQKKLQEVRERQARLPRLRIDSFAQTKIRVWTMAAEITE